MKNAEQIIEVARKIMRPERMLLAGTLVLQVTVMAWLYQQHQTQKAILQELSQWRAREPRVVRLDPPRHVSPLQVIPFANRAPSAPHPVSNPFVFPADNVQVHFNRMMRDAFENMERMSSLMNFDAGWDSLPASPTMDMRELADRYEVIYSLPGLHRNDLKVMLDGRLLTVASAAQENTHRQASYNRFESRVQLPGPVGDPQKAQADFTNGVLKVTVPRAGGQPEPQPASPTQLM